MQEMWVWSLGQEDPLEKEIATYSRLENSCLEHSMDRGAWWTIQSWSRERVGHDWATKQQQMMIKRSSKGLFQPAVGCHLFSVGARGPDIIPRHFLSLSMFPVEAQDCPPRSSQVEGVWASRQFVFSMCVEWVVCRAAQKSWMWGQKMLT